jgi:hypothetical protein
VVVAQRLVAEMRGSSEVADRQRGGHGAQYEVSP